MDLENIKQKYFKVKFGSKTNDINALTLLASLQNMTDMVQEINNELNQRTGENNTIEVRVKAFDKGSFIVDIGLLQATINGFMSTISVTDVAEIITILTGAFELRKFLGSKKAKNIEIQENIVNITNNNGDVIHTDKIIFNLYFDHPKITNSLNKIFERMDIDNTVDNLEIKSDENKTLFQIEKEFFKELSITVEYETNEKRTISETTQITVLTASFKKDYKWRFYYNGNKITAIIKDKEFLQSVDNRNVGFYCGDILDVDLQIMQEFDKGANTFVNKKYEIIRVIKYIPIEKQIPLF